MTLSIPCQPENGNWLPIHWTANINDDDAIPKKFNSVLQSGMQYFPEKLGFVFCEATHADIRPVENEEDSDNEDDEINIYTGTPFQLACKEYGHDAVIKIFNDRISDHCAAINSVAAAVTNTSPATCAESKLLLSTVTDKTIHLDGLYILMRNDPTAALLRLQQQLLIRERQTDNTNNKSNNDKFDFSNVIVIVIEYYLLLYHHQ
jgi:hypothetical protein